MYLVLDPVPVGSRLKFVAANVTLTGNENILQASSACAIASNFFLISYPSQFAFANPCGGSCMGQTVRSAERQGSGDTRFRFDFPPKGSLS
ncbi:hypothetical protein D9M70_644680 [compost metagenome]